MYRIPLLGLYVALSANGCPAPSPGIAPTPQTRQTTAAPGHLEFGVVGPNVKVRPTHVPAVAAGAQLRAARNEFESFQVLLTSRQGTVRDVSVALANPLIGADGAKIPSENVTLFREAYYDVGVPSNDEGARGRWPDALIPDVDVFYGEKRRAFPLQVPQGESRMIWVDVLVPMDAKPGDYRGELLVRAGDEEAGRIPISLRVGNFSLPSTASLASAFDMDYAQPCMAHTGTDTCDTEWNESAAYRMRELYVRHALDHRFTIFNLAFQPPFDSEGVFAKHMGGLIDGTGKTRLRGARVTSVKLDGDNVSKWIAFARAERFADRLVYYPVDEPHDRADWAEFRRKAERLHRADPQAKVLLTTSIEEARKHGAEELVDVFVPVVNDLEPHPADEMDGPKNRRSQYRGWMQGKPGRAVWGYQSCMSHGCGDCGEPSTARSDHGWPNRVIDTTAVQNRAFPWVAFVFDLDAELYFESTEQLTDAWNPNGQCKFSGSGDGTIYYPGKPSVIGGQSHIPVASIRVKLIREGMEDYEYLELLAKKDRKKALAIARTLFPAAYDCNKPAAQLEAARAELFTLLDTP